MKGWKEVGSLACLPQNFLLLSQNKFLAHSGDRMVSMAGVRAQSGPWDWGLACRDPVEDTADNAADLELWTQITECASWGPAVCLPLLVRLVNRLQSLEEEWFLFHSSDMNSSFILFWQGLGKLSSSCQPQLCVEHSLSPESAFPLSLDRCWCVGLWQSL